MLLGIGALLMAVLISLSRSLAQIPANLSCNLEGDVPIPKNTVFYWAVLFYNSTAMPLTGLIVLVVSILIPLSHYSEVAEETKVLACTSAAAIMLSLLALTIAVYSAFSLLVFGQYQHLTSAEFDGYKYNLGFRDFYVVIGKCDRFNIRCGCSVDITLDSEDYPGTSVTPSLEQNVKTKIIYIKTKSRNIPISK